MGERHRSEPASNINKQLKTLRAAKGLSQDELAKSAQNSQPAPENMSPEVARKHFLACPGGPSMQFRLGRKVTDPMTFNLNKLQAQPFHTTVWAFY